MNEYIFDEVVEVEEDCVYSDFVIEFMENIYSFWCDEELFYDIL